MSSAAGAEVWVRLEGKLDRVSDTMSGLDVRTARIEENISGLGVFQQKTELATRELDIKVSEVDKRVTGLEALEVSKVTERLQSLEGKIKIVYGVGMGVSAVVTVISGFVLWYLSNIVDKLV